jgi:hypothetical protein
MPPSVPHAVGEQVGNRDRAATMWHLDLAGRIPQRLVVRLRVDPLHRAGLPMPVDRQGEPAGGVPVGAALLGDPLLSLGTGGGRVLKNFTDAKQGHRAGARMGFPKPKRKGRSRDACRFTTGPIRLELDRHHVVLPRLGRIRTHESTRKLARRLEQGTARILAATISRQGGRWFVSFTCQVQRAVPGPHRPGWRVGVDVGIRHLAVLSDGRRVPNPAPLQQAQRRLRRRNRQLARRRGPLAPDGSHRDPSKRWQQTSRRLVQAHAKIANLRRNALHHLTSALAGTYGAVVVEHLNIAGMLRTTASPAASPTRAGGSCAASSVTRRPGRAGRSSRPTPSTRRRRPARAVGT